MKVVHVCTYDFGGAANAAYRLHTSLRAAGVDSWMVVGQKTREDDTVLEVPGWLHRFLLPLIPRIEYRFARFLSPRAKKPWLPSNLPGLALRFINQLDPDIVHLHWVEHGLLSIEQIGKIKQPIVWTLHDLSPLSPGYGYRIDWQDDCRPFRPLVPASGPYKRLAENVWKRKLREWSHLDFSLIAPCQWMADEARQSEVFKASAIQIIPYITPLETFRPTLDQAQSRQRLGLPNNRSVILFGADGKVHARKGADLLAEALQALVVRKPELCLAYFGQKCPPCFQDVEVEKVAFGRVNEPEKLAKIYASADVFVCPSREDNLPNTVLESLACGTPVIAFAVGGLSDAIVPGLNGYLAEPFKTDQIAEGCFRILKKPPVELRKAVRKSAESRYESGAIVLSHLATYSNSIQASCEKEKMLL